MLRPLQSEDVWQHRDATVLSLQRESLYLEIRSLYWKRDLVINSNGNMGVTYILNVLELGCSNLKIGIIWCYPWWRHQMEKSSALLALCAGNSPVPGDVDLWCFSLICALNKRLSKHSWGWWFETPSCILFPITTMPIGDISKAGLTGIEKSHNIELVVTGNTHHCYSYWRLVLCSDVIIPYHVWKWQ